MIQLLFNCYNIIILFSIFFYLLVIMHFILKIILLLPAKQLVIVTGTDKMATHFIQYS